MNGRSLWLVVLPMFSSDACDAPPLCPPPPRLSFRHGTSSSLAQEQSTTQIPFLRTISKSPGFIVWLPNGLRTIPENGVESGVDIISLRRASRAPVQRFGSQCRKSYIFSGKSKAISTLVDHFLPLCFFSVLVLAEAGAGADAEVEAEAEIEERRDELFR